MVGLGNIGFDHKNILENAEDEDYETDAEILEYGHKNCISDLETVYRQLVDNPVKTEKNTGNYEKQVKYGGSFKCQFEDSSTYVTQ